jgi:membrane protease YdiL (CAAX protease family)
MGGWEAGSLRSPRLWLALAVVILAYFITDPTEAALYHPLVHALGLHRSAQNTLGKGTYGLLMVVRLFWNGLVWLTLCKVLAQPLVSFPLCRKRLLRYTMIGLVTGLGVMLSAMLGIWLLRSATVGVSEQTIWSAIGNGCSWLALDFAGALGEELWGRAIVLVVAQRLLGWRGAMLISGLMFSGLHLSNHGATWVWLLRLFLQGMLLAYAVFRTGSLWWSVGYHTGWNWVSAPFFGAAGSGYLDEGHILNFFSRGSVWITGGSAGPEGSILAFVAVLAALGLLLLTTEQVPLRFAAAERLTSRGG